MTGNKILSERTKRLRGKKSFRAFAAECDVSEKSIRNLEAEKDVSLSLLRKVSSKCGVTISWLIGETDQRHPGKTSTQTVDNISGGVGSVIQTHDTQGSVTVNHESPSASIPDLSAREQELVLRLRRYAPQVMWERLEADLDELEKRYG